MGTKSNKPLNQKTFLFDDFFTDLILLPLLQEARLAKGIAGKKEILQIVYNRREQ